MSAASTTTSKRSGRQVEITTRTPVDPPTEMHGFVIVAISNNTRRYDGEITQDNFWAVTDLGGHLAISKTEYERLLNS